MTSLPAAMVVFGMGSAKEGPSSLSEVAVKKRKKNIHKTVEKLI